MHREALKPIIDKEWADSRTNEEQMTKIPPVSIAFRNATLKRMFDAETPERQSEVELWRQAQKGVEVDVETKIDVAMDIDEEIETEETRRYNIAAKYQK